jgi:hypothetical protein
VPPYRIGIDEHCLLIKRVAKSMRTSSRHCHGVADFGVYGLAIKRMETDCAFRREEHLVVHLVWSIMSTQSSGGSRTHASAPVVLMYGAES